jgi:uncharacterized protein
MRCNVTSHRRACVAAEDLGDAALAGLDQGERMTIPTLQDGGDWARCEADRRAMTPKFANTKPAPRYKLAGEV